LGQVSWGSSMNSQTPISKEFNYFLQSAPVFGQELKHALDCQRSFIAPGDNDLLQQVVGKGGDDDGYLYGGVTVAAGLRAALNAIGKDIRQFENILDFGCGSARVLRWFRDLIPAASLSGCDINAEAIQWCSENVSFARFANNGPLPPLPYPSGSFDLVYGVSVFTHLDEEYQSMWLAELQRITKPGGVILMTVHGEEEAARVLPPEELAAFQDSGFLYKKASEATSVNKMPEFYQVAFHSQRYVESAWARFFRIVGYFKHGCMYLQDVVAMLRESDEVSRAVESPACHMLLFSIQRTSLSRLFRFKMSWLIALSLITIAWCIPAFCDPIHNAAYAGDLQEVKTLLRNNPKWVSKKDSGGWTPLHLAAYACHKDVGEYLLSLGAEVNAKNRMGVMPLHIAAMNGHRDVAELLLAGKADLSAKDSTGYTALHIAAMMGRRDMVQLLLARGAEVDARSNEGETPLHCAASQREHAEFVMAPFGYVHVMSHFDKTPFPLSPAAEHHYEDVVNLLLSQGADVNARNKEGKTPLHEAAAFRNKDVAELLLAKGSEVNARNKAGETPLHEAALFGARDVGQLLLARGAEANARNKKDETPLHYAAAGTDLYPKSQKDMAELLLANKVDINARDSHGRTPLHKAAAGGYGNATALLIAHKADVNALDEEGMTPLDFAVRKGNDNAVKLLLAVDINAKSNDGRTPLHESVLYGDLAKAKALLDSNAALAFSKDACDKTPLHFAAMIGDIALAELLLANTAKINAKDADGRTPLHLAAKNGHRGMAQLLLAHGSDIFAKDNDGATPLRMTSAAGNNDMRKLLLDAELNAKSTDGMTPLHWAALNGDMAKVKLLLDGNPGLVSKKDNYRKTPLHFAAIHGRKEVAELLLAKKAEVNAKDKYERTPLHYAVMNGNKDVAELLRLHGGHE
jgi:ankyrin repeat protein/SAM-dependent methyltransferase